MVKNILVLTLLLAVMITSGIVTTKRVEAHADHGGEPSHEERLAYLKTIVTLLEYIKEFLEIHGETIAKSGVLMPQVHVWIEHHHDDVVQDPVITIEVDHENPHFHYTRSDGSTIESPIDSALDDREGLINELIILTRLSREEIEAITDLPE